MKEDEIAVLFKELEEAFGSLEIPPNDQLVQDTPWQDPERDQIREHFRDRHWRDLSIGDVTAEAEALSFFTPEAFRFFLPAFVKVSLLDPERADLIPDYILSVLAQLSGTAEGDERTRSILERAAAYGIPERLILELGKVELALDPLSAKRVAALDERQRNAVRSFVRFLRRHRQDDFEPENLDRVEAALSSR